MITNRSKLCPLLTDLNSGFFDADAKPSDFLFFDIETTGLSPKTSRVFLLGCLYCTDSQVFEIRQFFAEDSTDAEEYTLLKTFSDIVKTKKHLVHFNGTSFDLPYLIHRYEALGLEHPFSKIQQTDLYRELLHMPSFFKQMENHRQKTFETLVSYHREDTLSGKEMIKFYQKYQNSKNSDLLNSLFLHNANDLEGMMALLPLGHLRQLSAHAYEISRVEEITEKDRNGISQKKLLFTLQLPQAIPAQLSLNASFCYITVLNHTAKIKMPLYEGTLKYFYTDYRNYYYLPFEDEAVHRSIGIYTEASHRQRAKASNCYKKFSGYFVYAPGNPDLPLLRESYSSKEHYALWPFPENNSKVLSSYLHEVLKTAITQK